MDEQVSQLVVAGQSFQQDEGRVNSCVAVSTVVQHPLELVMVHPLSKQ